MSTAPDAPGILYLRFRKIGGGLPDGAGYEGLLALLGAFTPVVEAVPPDGALADVRGALRYFGRDARGLASVIRIRALALHGVDCAIGAAENPMLARMAARQAAPGATFVVPGGGGAEFLADRPPRRWTVSVRRRPAPCADTGSTPSAGSRRPRSAPCSGSPAYGPDANCGSGRAASTVRRSCRAPRPGRSQPNAPSRATSWTGNGSAAHSCRSPRSWGPGCAGTARSAAA